jgi:hypothetical protein
MTYKLIITVTHHPDGKVTVSQNLTAPLLTDEERQLARGPESFRPPSEVFDTPEEAKTFVAQLVSENGGRDMVKIDRHDFRPKPAS